MYIEIDKEAIPYRFEIELGGELFEMEIKYNQRFDFFTVDLYRDDELLLAGQKIVYGQPLFPDYDNRFPKVPIIPMDESGTPIDRITYDNFGESVLLLVGEVA